MPSAGSHHAPPTAAPAARAAGRPKSRCMAAISPGEATAGLKADEAKDAVRTATPPRVRAILRRMRSPSGRGKETHRPPCVRAAADVVQTCPVFCPKFAKANDCPLRTCGVDVLRGKGF